MVYPKEQGPKIMLNLKFIQLKYVDRLSRFPDVSEAPNIERLTLYACKNLVEIHESLGLLKRLVYLEMPYCRKLKCLPSRFELESLETLILHGCNSLKRLPEFALCMAKLSHMDIRQCDSLKELPSSIRNVSNLSTLNMRCCFQLHLWQAESIFHDLKDYLCSLRKLDLKYIEIRDQDFPKNLYGLSFLEELYKWVAIDGCLSISISGSKIPGWFEEQHGNKIELKLPFKWQTQIKGFAICGMFSWSMYTLFPSIGFRFENDETLVAMLEVDYIYASATKAVDDEYGTMWIGYVPLSLLENMHHEDNDDDWSHIIEGTLVLELTNPGAVDPKAVRCGAQVVYKEEVESTQQIIKPSMSSHYWKWNLTHDTLSRKTTVYDFGDQPLLR